MAERNTAQIAPGEEAGRRGQDEPYIGWRPYVHYGQPLNQAFWSGYVEVKQEAPEYV